MNKPETDEEWAMWLAESLMGWEVATYNKHGFAVEVYAVNAEKEWWSGHSVSSWNPFKKENLWQMFECVEKVINGSDWEFNHYYQGYGDDKVHIIELKTSDPYRANPIISKHESLPQAIAECLWEAVEGATNE